MTDRIVCECGKGYASREDNLCCFCRENKYRRAECKAVGVRHRGDGLSLDQEHKLNLRRLPATDPRHDFEGV